MSKKLLQHYCINMIYEITLILCILIAYGIYTASVYAVLIDIYARNVFFIEQ